MKNSGINNACPKKPLSKRIAKHWQLHLVLLLPVIYLVVFRYVPILGSVIAFKDYNFRDGIFGSPWVGFKHFITFFKSVQFDRVMINTLGLSFYSIIVGIFPPIILAISVSYARHKWSGKIVQMITYMPYFISTVLVVSILSQLLAATGPINMLITSFGGEKITFLGEPKLFKSIYVFSGIWQTTGYNAVIYIAALSAVDEETHEAATVDGANIWQRIWNIDIPSIMPTATILLIMSCGHILSIGYEKVLLLQNNLNISTSDIISTYVYRIGLTSMQYSYSTAIGIFQSVVSLVLLLFVNTLSKRFSETSLF